MSRKIQALSPPGAKESKGTDDHEGHCCCFFHGSESQQGRSYRLTPQPVFQLGDLPSERSKLIGDASDISRHAPDGFSCFAEILRCMTDVIQDHGKILVDVPERDFDFLGRSSYLDQHRDGEKNKKQKGKTQDQKADSPRHTG
jgi:hypothetical protein